MNHPGVMVNYQPEDTMKSMLLSINNNQQHDTVELNEQLFDQNNETNMAPIDLLPKRQPKEVFDNEHMKDATDDTVNQNGASGKSKRAFLKKNQGFSAWNCKIKKGENFIEQKKLENKQKQCGAAKSADATFSTTDQTKSHTKSQASHTRKYAGNATTARLGAATPRKSPITAAHHLKSARTFSKSTCKPATKTTQASVMHLVAKDGSKNLKHTHRLPNNASNNNSNSVNKALAKKPDKNAITVCKNKIARSNAEEKSQKSKSKRIGIGDSNDLAEFERLEQLANELPKTHQHQLDNTNDDDNKNSNNDDDVDNDRDATLTEKMKTGDDAENDVKVDEGEAFSEYEEIMTETQTLLLNNTQRPRKVCSMLSDSVRSNTTTIKADQTQSESELNSDAINNSQCKRVSWKHTDSGDETFTEEEEEEEERECETKEMLPTKEETSDSEYDSDSANSFVTPSTLRKHSNHTPPTKSSKGTISLDSGKQEASPPAPTAAVTVTSMTASSSSSAKSGYASQMEKLYSWINLLEQEMRKFEMQNREIAKLKEQSEATARQLDKDKREFDKSHEENTQKFESYRKSELDKISRRKKELEEMREMPDKKERLEIKTLRNEMDELRDEFTRKEERWQSTHSRMSQRIDQLERDKTQLEHKNHVLEETRLSLENKLDSLQESLNEKTRRLTEAVQERVSAESRAGTGLANVPGNMPGSTPGTGIGFQYKVIKESPSTGGGNPLRNSSASDYCTEEDAASSHGGEYALPHTLRNPATLSQNQQQHSTTSAGSQAQPSSRRNRMCSTAALMQLFDKSESELIFHVLQLRGVSDCVTTRLMHRENIQELRYSNSSSQFIFPNGTEKHVSADGQTAFFKYCNNDFKIVHPDRTTIYYYAQDPTLQITHATEKSGASAEEEFLLKNGDRILVKSDGSKERHNADGTVLLEISSDGAVQQETRRLNDGVLMQTQRTNPTPNSKANANSNLNSNHPHATPPLKQICFSDGRKELHTDQFKCRVYPDGTTKTVYNDGKQETRYSSGRIRIKDKHGNLILDSKAA